MSNNYNDDDLNDFNDNDDILKDDGFIDSDDNSPDEDTLTRMMPMLYLTAMKKQRKGLI